MLNRRYLLLLRVVLAFSLSTAAFAKTFILPPEDQDIIGNIQSTRSKHEDTLLDLAHRYDIGQNEIVVANPGVDRWIPGDNTRIVLPTRFILPDAPRKGIVLNVPEMRLFFYTKDDRTKKPIVITHPVSIGRMDWNTPLGITRIIAKTKDPVWRPPQSIKDEHAEEGDPLPDIVPPGPDNPLGRYALRLAVPGYLIHSTNKPLGIGMRVTHGCVRMYPDDIEKLFQRVAINTPVHIVNQAIKLGWLMDTLYIEVNPALQEDQQSYDELLTTALNLIEFASPSFFPKLNGAALRKALREPTGIPIAIANRLGDEVTYR